MTQGDECGPPVDPGARFALAALLEEFAAGRITNEAFERDCPGGKDPAVAAVVEAALMFSDDCRVHRARLAPEGREAVARWAAFLRSGRPYVWPPLLWPGAPAAPRIRRFARWRRAMGWSGALSAAEAAAFLQGRDHDVWPYACEADRREDAARMRAASGG